MCSRSQNGKVCNDSILTNSFPYKLVKLEEEGVNAIVV